MPLLFLVPTLFLGGALAGSLANNATTPPTQVSPLPSTGKMVLYGVAAVGAYIAYKKFGK